MITIRLQWSAPGVAGIYDLVEDRVIARSLTKADAERIAAILNSQPTPSDLEKQAAVNRKLDELTYNWAPTTLTPDIFRNCTPENPCIMCRGKL
jgi:hypothetical protein